MISYLQGTEIRKGAITRVSEGGTSSSSMLPSENLKIGPQPEHDNHFLLPSTFFFLDFYNDLTNDRDAPLNTLQSNLCYRYPGFRLPTTDNQFCRFISSDEEQMSNNSAANNTATSSSRREKDPRFNRLPLLQRLNKNETNCIMNAFKLYDPTSLGKIAVHLAVKLMKSLGLSPTPETISNIIGSSAEITMYDFLTVVDKLMPEPEPILLSSLDSFNSFAGQVMADPNNPEKEIRVLNPQSIADFMESLGRPPINMNEASLMLNSMLEYDDCSEIPLVNVEVFNKEVINFAKKTNAFKDYRG